MRQCQGRGFYVRATLGALSQVAPGLEAGHAHGSRLQTHAGGATWSGDQCSSDYLQMGLQR